MSEILLVNPRKRRRKAHRSAAQKAATRRMLAARFGRKSNPAKRRRRASAAPVARVRRRVHHKVSAVSHRRRRRHHNPIKVGGFLKGTVMPSAIGAGGALALDVLLGYLPLPAIVQGPAIRPVVRIAGALALGLIVGKVAGRRNGELAAAGAVTVTLYDVLKGFAKTAMPSLPLSEYVSEYVADYPNPAQVSYMPAGMGEYVNDSQYAAY